MQAKGGYGYRSIWRPGHSLENLGGTARTLDEADGRVPLEDGVLGRNPGSRWSTTRAPCCSARTAGSPRAAGTSDLYVFAYGRDYRAALRALQAHRPAAAAAPLRARQLVEPLLRLQRGRVPGADGPLRAGGPAVQRRGARHGLAPGRHRPRWAAAGRATRSTASCSPDPQAFMAELHERGLARSRSTCTPPTACARTRTPTRRRRADGHRPGLEAAGELRPGGPEFLEAYLEVLHHPLEDEGVDFWWLDWQQGR